MRISQMKKFETGYATLIMVLIVLSVILMIITTFGLLTYNDLRNINNIVSSSQSYYAAEAGIEDALLRIVNNMNYSGNYDLDVGEGSTEVEVTGPLTALVITSNGNVDNRFRKLRVELGATQNPTNVSFNYGVQVGYGGLHMSNGSRVNGNVYSNGPITSGPNNPDVTGTVFSASGASAYIDQANDNPPTPPNTITFGNASASEDAAQSFQIDTTDTSNRVDLYIRKQGSGNPGNLTVRITNNSGGNPGTTTLTQGTLSSSSLTNSFGWVSVTFAPRIQLNAGITYWLVLDDSSSNSSNYFVWGANSAYTNGEAKTGRFSGAWNSTSLDGYFRLYLGGSIGSIDGIDIGTGGAGNGHANTITSSTATGTLYCQTGSGNNKDCDTSQPDPVPEDLPISELNINQWKAEAAAGGTIIGNYTPPGTSTTLGPTEITGNLTIPVGYNLTVAGTIWVHGSIDFGNGAIVNLHPAYGDNSGMILADGYILIGNNVIFSGSGQTGSYIMVLTTNDCNGISSPTGAACTTNNSAMYVRNNAQNVILYAANGQLRLNQGANTKEATAYRLYLEENVTVTYEGGLASARFISGPGGGFQIRSWSEVE